MKKRPIEIRDMELPGEFPYTRGLDLAENWRGHSGVINCRKIVRSTSELSLYLRNIAAGGQLHIWLDFDNLTLKGKDGDDETEEDNHRLSGINVSTLQDMEDIFEGISLENVNLHINAGAMAPVVLGMYVAACEARGVPADELSGSVGNDVLSEFAVGGGIFPTGPSMRLVGDVIEYCIYRTPKYRPLVVRGSIMREAGCCATDEIAFAIGNAAAYMDQALANDLRIDKIAPLLDFDFATGIGFFEEVAKYRAARRVWARLLRDKYGAKYAPSTMLRFHARTLSNELASEECENNIARAALQSLASILGGAKSVAALPHDCAGLPQSDKSSRVAARTQQIIEYETGVTNTADPFGGAWHVEQLTDEIERAATARLEYIFSQGGMTKLLRKGYIQREIARQSRDRQAGIRAGKTVVVGHNKFASAGEAAVPGPERTTDPMRLEAARERLAKVRANRDGERVRETLSVLREAAASKDNLMPYIIYAAQAHATVGEITGALKAVFGERRPTEKDNRD